MNISVVILLLILFELIVSEVVKYYPIVKDNVKYSNRQIIDGTSYQLIVMLN